MNKEVSSIRLPEQHKKMIFDLKTIYKTEENLDLTTTDIILCAIKTLWSIKSNKMDTI